MVPYSTSPQISDRRRSLEAVTGIGTDPVFDAAVTAKKGCTSANPSQDVNRIGDLCISSRGSVNWSCKMTEYTKQCDFEGDLCYLPGERTQEDYRCSDGLALLNSFLKSLGRMRIV